MATKSEPRRPGRPRKYEGGRINATVRFTPQLHEDLKAAARAHRRSVSEECELRIARLAQWETTFRDPATMASMLGRQTDDEIAVAMRARGWGKVVDPRYGGPIYIPPGQHVLPTNGFIDPAAEDRERAERAEATRRQEARLQELMEAAVVRALAKARLTIGGEGP